MFAGLCSCQALLRRGCVGELLLVVVVATRRPQREGRLHGVAASRCRASRALALAGVGGSSGSGRGMVEFECPLAGGVVGARSNTWARCVACWSAADQDGGLRAGRVARSTRREGQSSCECLTSRLLWSARRLRAQMDGSRGESGAGNQTEDRTGCYDLVRSVVDKMTYGRRRSKAQSVHCLLLSLPCKRFPAACRGLFSL